MDMTVILIGVIVIVVVAFFLMRKKPELPAAEPEKPAALPKAEKPAEKVEKSPKPAEAPKSATIELPSKDVLPAADSVPSAEAKAAVAAPPPAKPGKRDVGSLRKGLAATRGGFIARLTALVTGKKEIDPAILEQIEEVMLTSDVGVKTTQAILEEFVRSLIQRVIDDTLNDALPALPIPSFTVPDSLSSYGIPRGTELGLRSPALILRERHLVLESDFGTR